MFLAVDGELTGGIAVGDSIRQYTGRAGSPPVSIRPVQPRRLRSERCGEPAGSGRFGRAGPNTLKRFASVVGSKLSVRYGLGRAGRFGRPNRKPCPVFDLLTPNRALRRTENPRVGGSIPPLATTPNL